MRLDPQVAGQLYEALAHGDADHRGWLMEAILAFQAGQPIPQPRGSGSKEARIAELEAQVLRLQEQLTARGTLTLLVAKDGKTETVEFKPAERPDLYEKWKLLVDACVYM